MMPRTVLLTGASRGIGRETARELKLAGFQLFLTGRDAGLLKALQKELDCPGAALDLSHPNAPAELFGAAIEALGHVDVLINNAGFNRAKNPVVSVEREELDDSYALNVRAPILLAREGLKHMGPRGRGHIVNIVSSIVFTRTENYAVYTTMKAALQAFTGCLIKEARQVGVKVTGVYPGGVNTSFRATARPDYMRPESVAKVVLQCITAPDDAVIHEILFRPMVETNF